ncbi:hypothetical protein D3C75_559050 [compost metagenome]
MAREGEDFGHGDDLAFHAVDFLHADQATLAVLLAFQLDHHIDGRSDLLTHGLDREGRPGHRHHVLDPPQRIARGVGVDRGQRAVVAGVHRRQHVQRLGAAHFANHNAVGTHPQAVAHQLPLAHLAAPLDVRRPGFQAHHVGLLQLQFGRVLDGDDPLVVRNETGQDIEHGGLAAAGTAGNQHVQAPTDNRLEQQGNGRGQRPHLDQAVGIEQVHRKAPDRHARAVDGQRRDNRVDPRTVLEPGIHQGRRLVDTPPQAGDDAVNDVQQMLIIAKTHIGALQLAEALDIH